MSLRIALLLLAVSALPAGAAGCDSDAWAFYGAVRDPSGNPIGDAEVFLLLDKIDQSEYLAEGVRGRRFRANQYGKYQAGLICDANSDNPNPCAKKLKHLTVVVSSPDHTMKMRVFKLRELEIRAEDGVCLVHVPEMQLRKGF